MMENIDKLLEQANTSLNDKLQQLEILETEKKEIVSMYEKARPTEKVLFEVEMKNSEEKYKNLCNEVLTLSEEVKKLKKRFC